MLSNSLKAFYETVQAGSIRKASEKMNLAPSSVSRQIAQLEHEIGTELLERGPGGAKLTHAGRLVADFAGPALFDYEALRSDLNDLRGHRRRRIRVGATASAIHMGIARTMSRFQQQYDSTVFHFECLSAENMIRAIRTGDFDVGIALSPDPHPDVEVIQRVPEPSLLVVASSHPIAGRATISMAEAATLDFALLSESYVVRRTFDAECRRAGIIPNIVLESGNVTVLIEFVREGCGATLLPHRTLPPDLAANGLAVLDIADTPLGSGTLEILIARNRRIATIVRRFVECLREDFPKPDP